MLLMIMSAVMWFGVFLVLRSYHAAKKEKEITDRVRMNAAMKGVDTTPAPAPVTKGPSLAAKAANATAKASAKVVKFAAPRVVAGTAVLAKSTHKAGKAAMQKVAAAQAKPQPVETPVTGGNVLSPEQEKTLQTPAFMRAGKHLGNVVQFPKNRTLH